MALLALMALGLLAVAVGAFIEARGGGSCDGTRGRAALESVDENT